MLVTKLGLNLGCEEGEGHCSMVALTGKMRATKLGPVCLRSWLPSCATALCLWPWGSRASNKRVLEK